MRSAIDIGADRPWFIRTNPRPNARMRLFCFPYAGGAAAIYRQWPNGLPSDVEIVALELPGRGGRMKEVGFRNVSKLITAIAEVIAPRIDREFAFFGHSMGALIAFELARELRRQGRSQPKCLFVSGRRAPHIPDTDPITYNLPEAEFIQELRKLNGTPKEVLDHEELMNLMIPLLRTDFELIQTYEHNREAPLDCPISVYGGIGDVDVPRDLLLPWKEQTTAAFAIHMLPGDHFFLRSASSELLTLLSAELFKLLRQLPA